MGVKTLGKLESTLSIQGDISYSFFFNGNPAQNRDRVAAGRALSMAPDRSKLSKDTTTPCLNYSHRIIRVPEGRRRKTPQGPQTWGV